MAVSKRTRFEVLRRDNHTCRYCGGIARKRIEKLHEAARALLDEEDTRGA